MVLQGTTDDKWKQKLLKGWKNVRPVGTEAKNLNKIKRKSEYLITVYITHTQIYAQKQKALTRKVVQWEVLRMIESCFANALIGSKHES